MKVLVTGHRGRLGAVVTGRLEAAGHEVVGFDRADGHDVLDAAALERAAHGTRAAIHLAGLADDRGGDPSDVMSVNVLGTWNVLLAARANGLERVVHLSSGKALGMLERDPAYLPVDDAHPGLPSRPYGLSKWLSEEMCEAFARETGITTLCLRPVAVLDDERYAALADLDELPADPSRPWHLGVVVDVRDVADAMVAALVRPAPLHARLLLCADDVASDRPTAELVAEHLPGVPWRVDACRPQGAARPALADTSAARSVLGWRPAHGWADRPRPTSRASARAEDVHAVR